jgi:hypothetical protein
MPARLGARPIRRTCLQLSLAAIVVGFVAHILVVTGVFDRPHAYGKLQVPGRGTFHFPKRTVDASLQVGLFTTHFHGLTVPPLRIAVTPSGGGPRPSVVRDVGGTTSDETQHTSSYRERVWKIGIPRAGDYTVAFTGSDDPYPGARILFGHGSPKWSKHIWSLSLLAAALFALLALAAHRFGRRGIRA